MKKLLVGFLTGLLLAGCTLDSQITSSWKSNTIKKRYENIMVLALTHDATAKSIVENDLSAALTARDISNTKSIDAFGPKIADDMLKDEMLVKIRHTGADAILTVSLINKQTQTHYVPGTPGYVPGFWGYYNYWYPTFYTPGYYAQDRVYYIETNLYDVTTDELLWTAQSETYNPSSLTGFSKDLAALLSTKLVRDHVIAPHQKSRHQK